MWGRGKGFEGGRLKSLPTAGRLLAEDCFQSQPVLLPIVFQTINLFTFGFRAGRWEGKSDWWAVSSDTG